MKTFSTGNEVILGELRGTVLAIHGGGALITVKWESGDTSQVDLAFHDLRHAPEVPA